MLPKFQVGSPHLAYRLNAYVLHKSSHPSKNVPHYEIGSCGSKKKIDLRFFFLPLEYPFGPQIRFTDSVGLGEPASMQDSPAPNRVNRRPNVDF